MANRPIVKAAGTDGVAHLLGSGSPLPYVEGADALGMLRCDMCQLSSETVLVEVAGEIDVQNAEPFRSLLLGLGSGRGRMVLLDLQDVGFFGARAVGVLLEAADICRQHGISLRLINLSSAVRRPLVTLGCANLFDIGGNGRC